ncbi:MAG: hypothetical protein EXS36_19680 [Pedosphaera sp.]|nr:hypothetical protein [Pedosphaera sp.]
MGGNGCIDGQNGRQITPLQWWGGGTQHFFVDMSKLHGLGRPPRRSLTHPCLTVRAASSRSEPGVENSQHVTQSRGPGRWSAPIPPGWEARLTGGRMPAAAWNGSE